MGCVDQATFKNVRTTFFLKVGQGKQCFRVKLSGDAQELRVAARGPYPIMGPLP